MARDEPQVNFRIPTDLKAKLEVDAKANNRTLTAEIVARLQGPSPIDLLKEKMENSSFKMNYEFARFGIQMFLTVGQMVIDDASEKLRQTKSFKLLHQLISTTRIPPELPARQPPAVQDVSWKHLERTIADISKAMELREARAKTGDVES